MTQANALLAGLEALVEDGMLRHLGVAFARFIATLSAASPAIAADAAPAAPATTAPLVLASAVLSELEGRGHSCLNLGELAADPCALLGWTREQWEGVLDASGPLPADAAAWQTTLGACTQVWVVGTEDRCQPLVLDRDRLYLRRYWRNETLVARQAAMRAACVREVDAARVRDWLDRLFDAAAQEAPAADAGPDWQRIACAIAVRSSFSIITGGPGTGKTYTVARLLALLFALAEDPERLRIALAAPTGKAAARLKQSIDDALGGLVARVGAALPLAQLAARLPSAGTLHSLLGARPDTRALRHHAGNPLDIDVLVVDEASMVHLEMMAALLDALPATTMLILLGDKDQLASVEAGAVLGDLCSDAQHGAYVQATADYALAASGQVIAAEMLGAGDMLAQQTVMLRKSRRFGGPIGALASAVNAGDPAAVQESLRCPDGGPVHWIAHARQSDVLALATDGRAGAAGGYRAYLALLQKMPRADDAADPVAYEAWVKSVLLAFDTFRILCAVREGEWGVAGLNQAIEQRLEREGLIRRRGEWYAGRPVMVSRNDYGVGVFNGDIGIVLPDPARADAQRVYFLNGDAVRSVLATRLAAVETAYAMTVHKSQGSEFRHVAMVLPPEAGQVVARELVYTGITRARECFTLVTPAAAVLEAAVLRKTKRASGLQVLLGEAAMEEGETPGRI
ncbi:exodeoxyribonuclease V subunit alpha [Janthinobacterium sp. 17J80-10]|uniref:exodeoxyribonuclease V subunit alpha n=1 Tax=Janthinobacterium sp. 17J80-10 TaxID=2497863 RepID=UPI0010059B12|nr:exodeoxyribonuclease V subunit alpha [Janthinobacterium sp. 17J80-10]QAU32801.1 exodeoxyribonuclease V subunit alpha [Janthinobacterium sp. 17J80-10]